MRKDMFKVIVERPRSKVAAQRGLANPARYLKHFKLDEDGEVTDGLHGKVSMKEGFHRPKVIRKYLNENLAPLKRYLTKQVGRKWDDVYHDICENLDTGSTVKQHVRDHIRDFVILYPTFKMGDGLYYNGPYNYQGPTRVTGSDLYVDDQGVLRHGPGMTDKQYRKARWDNKIAEENKNKVKIDDALHFEREGGVWFKYVTNEVWRCSTDWVRNTETNSWDKVTRTYKEKITNRYTANKKEIRDYKLNSKR